MFSRFSYKLFFLFLWPLFSLGQEAVQLNCIEVMPSGNVTISWKPTLQINGFLRYEIFYSTNNNTYSKIDEINTVGTSQYIDLNTNANGGSKYYYVNSVYNNGEAPSNTLQSMFLEVDNNVPLYNQASLIWNAISNPLPGGSSGIYKIYEEYPIGNWFERATTTSLSDTLDVIVCLDSISFRVEMENSSGCTSVSNATGAIFKDAIYPLKPVFDSVSINNAGEAVLGWQPAIDGDVEGYIIYRLENSAWIEIQRVDGRDSVFYTDASVDPCADIFTYAIAAIDSCTNKSPGTFSEPLNTILIENVEFDVCSMSNTILWSPYINSQPALDGYKIYCSIDSDPFSEVGFVTGDTLFVHAGLVGGSTYNYYVQAIFGNKSSSSCKQSIKTYSYIEPQFVYLANANVLPSNAVELTVDVDTTVNNCTWEIWSFNENDLIPVLDTAISRDELSRFPLVYTDESADAASAYYTYYVVVKDSCGNIALQSDSLTTIKLGGTELSETQIQLDWTAFKGWDEGVERYYIFRMAGSLMPTSPIDSVSPETFTYVDDISQIDNSAGIFCYWVQAKQNPGNPYGYQELSNSNRICQAQDTQMYMPNAFRPGGTTAVFKPIFRYFTGSQYLFQIYNRWGQLIFETTNPEEGWNGQYNNLSVPLGVYVYKVSYNNLENKSVLLKGTVTVVY